MEKYFARIAKISLVLVYLVIVAGALVRMTGSGMGCPDWPKCFGYYIPPSDIKELTWEPNREFRSGEVIIKDERLLVADGDFTTGNSFDAAVWRPYTKHDYALFNPTHTWIEYVNRLVGALAGFAVLAMAVVSLRFRKENKKITIFSWLTVLLMGLQGWLGAKVVYSVLNPLKITLHMVVALVIVSIILYILRMAKPQHEFHKDFLAVKIILLFALSFSLIQIVLGTQVRQFVDEQIKTVGYKNMQLVLRNPIIGFYIHRTFSLAVLLANLTLYFYLRNLSYYVFQVRLIVILIAIEILSGMTMYYFSFPFGSQALHLVIASLIFGFQADLFFKMSFKNHSVKL